jgi:hypothetical protein
MEMILRGDTIQPEDIKAWVEEQVEKKTWPKFFLPE